MPSPSKPAVPTDLPLLPTLTVEQAIAELDKIGAWRSWPALVYAPTLRVTSCTGSNAARSLWRLQSLRRAAACLVLGVAYRDIDKCLPPSPPMPGRNERYTGRPNNGRRDAAAA